MTVIETRGLRRDFTVRVKKVWLRRDTRVIAAVKGIDISVERGEPLGYIGSNDHQVSLAVALEQVHHHDQLALEHLARLLNALECRLHLGRREPEPHRPAPCGP